MRAHKLSGLVVPAAVTVVLLGVVLHGFRAEPLLANAGWSPVGRYRLIHYTKIYWTVSLALLLTVPAAFAPIVAVLVAAATVIAIGPLALLAVAVFLIASCALGSTLLGACHDSSADRQLCASLLGIAVYIFLMTFLARLPVNYAAVYLVLLAIPVLIDFRGMGRRLASWGSALVRSGPRPRPQVAAFMLLVFVLGMHWLIVPQPEASGDGLSMHLAIPADIAQHHIFTYRPGRIFWSVMPMGADWCYAIVYELGGEFAARLLNFAMLLLVEALLYRAARRFVSPAIAFVILALFASTSLVQLVTGSLYIENFLAAMVIGMAVALWQFGDTGHRRYLYTAAVLGGTALATKFGGLAYVAAALPVAAIEIRRQWGRLGPRPALSSGIGAALLLAAALPPYAIAWRMTGDPLYPFLNRTFPSPLVDRAATFADYRFNQPLTFSTPYDLTFHSDRYCEGRPGSIGFAYLMLMPLGLTALLAVTRRPAVSAAAISIGGAAIVLKLLPNARYLYPALPLMLVPFAAFLGWLAPGILRRALITIAVGCVVLNIWFLPSSNVLHADFYEQAPLSRGMRQAYIHKNAPIREVGQYMNRTHPGVPVFLADGSGLSAFDAEVYAYGWHQYGVWARLQSARSPGEIAGILDRWNVHYVAAPKPGSGVAVNPRTLQDFLTDCVTPEFQAGYLFLARIENSCRSAGQAGREPSIVPPGIYDDFDPAIAFRGPWNQDKGWPQTHSHTVTYSNLPGSEVRFAFSGGLLTYVYTKAANRGKADIAIDGGHVATLDLYSRQTEWQSRTTFKVDAGRHLAVITILPDKNTKSSDRFIDVDALEVQ
ncbi:MAG TPA: glycosyltransferase family 39 protein [Bryobacteraceae bacterium]|nr:glycosyltransferase family 39 protein [Bryobacteraceae bacterium]